MRGILMWIGWVSGSMLLQGTSVVMSVFMFNGKSGRGGYGGLEWCYSPYCAVLGARVEWVVCLVSWVRSDQDCTRAAGVASGLNRNRGFEEVGGYSTIRDLLRDLQVVLGQT
eukprot:411251-Pelagomonas_calceolata.AAC.1